MIYMGNQIGVPMTIAKSVQQVNLDQQARFARRIIGHFDGRKNVQIGVWGLSFKARTDDIRESPAIFCIEKFLDAGFKVVAFDPEAMAPAKQKLGDRIRSVENGYDVLEGSDALAVFTDWQEFRTPDFEQIAKRLNKPLIFDGRNLYTPSFVKRFGIEYHCIGRPC
jgi:UDPglucose 6-dehydrogenase